MKKQTPQTRLETVYWINWCGDTLYARQRMIKLADEVLGRNSNEPQTPCSKQEKAEEVEEDYERWSDDYYVIR